MRRVKEETPTKKGRSSLPPQEESKEEAAELYGIRTPYRWAEMPLFFVLVFVVASVSAFCLDNMFFWRIYDVPRL